MYWFGRGILAKWRGEEILRCVLNWHNRVFRANDFYILVVIIGYRINAPVCAVWVSFRRFVQATVISVIFLPGGMTMILVADILYPASSVILFAHFSTYWFGSLFNLSSASPKCFSFLTQARSQNLFSVSQRISYCSCTAHIHRIGYCFSSDELLAICTWIRCSFSSWHVFYWTRTYPICPVAISRYYLHQSSKYTRSHNIRFTTLRIQNNCRVLASASTRISI